jgi:K+ transporter
VESEQEVLSMENIVVIVVVVLVVLFVLGYFGRGRLGRSGGPSTSNQAWRARSALGNRATRA